MSTFDLGRPVCDRCKPWAELGRLPGAIWLRKWHHSAECEPETVTPEMVLEVAQRTSNALDGIIETLLLDGASCRS
jgi:hypothetical protein